MTGEREVSFDGRIMPASDALSEIDVEPLVLAPRDTLALMNGTSAMTGLASLALWRALGGFLLGLASVGRFRAAISPSVLR